MTDRNSSTTSISLIDAAREQDQVAWQQLCDIYTPLTYQWIRNANLQDTDADDLIQNVFRNVVANLDSFRKEKTSDTFRGWLWTITRNELRAWFRNQSSRVDKAKGGTAVQNRLAAIPDWIARDTTLQEIDPDDNAEHVVVHRAAKLIEQDYEPHTWQAFWRTAVEGDPATDVAADLDMTPGAVRQAKLRVLVRLRTMLS